VVLVHTTVAVQAFGAWYARPLNHLDIGVTIFFLISGFLLYRPFVAARVGAGPRIGEWDYARRRALRILPAYYLALIVLAVYPGLQGVFGGNWWVYFGFLQSYTPLYDAPASCGAPPFDCGIAPAWSLVVEVSFYALLPLFAALMSELAPRLRRPVRIELVCLAGLAAVSFAVRRFAFTHADEYFLLDTLAGTFFWFAAGMSLAIASVALTDRERKSRFTSLVADRPWVPWAAAAALYALLCWVLPTTPSIAALDNWILIQYGGFGLIAFLLLAPAVFGDGQGGVPRRILANPLLSWLGLISYGIFLWHLPIAFKLSEVGFLEHPVWLRLAFVSAATLAISIACAAASYYLLERPLLRFKYRRAGGRGQVLRRSARTT
jgi:peptidoglycan/LPS O-acetylase OafA/YrhL